MARAKGPKPLALESGPWGGTRDVVDPGSAGQGLLYDAVNMYAPDVASGSDWYARPGFALTNSGSALGTVSGRVGQGVYHFTALDGTEFALAFCGGKVYRATVASWTWVDVTPTTVPIHPSNRIHCVTIADAVVWSDGANKPVLYVPQTALGSQLEYSSDATVRLSIGTVDPTKVKVAAMQYTASHVSGAVVATEVTLPAGGVPADQWGVFRVQITTGGAFSITAGAANFTTGYASEAAAIAAVPTVAATDWNVGYFTVRAQPGAQWDSSLDELTGGGGGSVAATTSYYAGAALPWATYGAPTIKASKVVFIAQHLNNVFARNAILWSEEAQPGVGYQQTGYDNLWEITQNDTDALTAIKGTNDALYYWRADSIGAILGDISPAFRTSTTQDAVSLTKGTTCSAIAQWEGSFFFPDQRGEVQRLRGGAEPDPVGLDMRRAIETTLSAASAAQSSLAQYAAATVDITTGVVLFALWGAGASANTPPVTLYAFHGPSGRYLGTWTIGGGIAVDALGWLKDANGRPVLIAIGATSSSAYNATTNAGSVWRLTLPSEATWTDNGTAFTRSVTPQSLMKDGNVELYVDTLTAEVDSTLPVALTVTTPRASGTSIGTATPVATSDGTGRAIWGVGSLGRGARCTFSPTTSASQWKVSRVTGWAFPDGPEPGAP